MVASCKGSDWHARTIRAWGKAEANARNNELATKKQLIHRQILAGITGYLAVIGQPVTFWSWTPYLPAPKAYSQPDTTRPDLPPCRFLELFEAAGKMRPRQRAGEAAQREGGLSCPCHGHGQGTDAFRGHGARRP